MAPEQILKFIEAGYTKADIEKMETSHEPETAPENTKPEEGVKDPAVDPQEPDTNTQTMNELLKSVQGLTETVKGLQEQNIKNAQQPPEDHKGFSDLVADFTKNM